MAKNTGMYLLLAGGTALAVGAGVAYARGKKKKTKKRVTGCTTAPYQWDANAVTASIESLIDDGERDAGVIAQEAATEHFGNYPNGGLQAFPPDSSPARGVNCVWQKTNELVGQLLASHGGPMPRPHEILQEWVRDEPTPGFLYRAKPGEPLSHVAGKALAAAGVPNPQNNNGVYVNRWNYLKMIECSPWNDAILSTDSSGAGRGPDGRGISFNAVHADNQTRMMMGQAPRRAATGKSSHDGTGGHLPFLWLPALEVGQPVPVIAEWSDGYLGINPPAEILAFGMENVFPGQYGCDPWRDEAAEI